MTNTESEEQENTTSTERVRQSVYRSEGVASRDDRDRGRFVAGDEAERFWSKVDRHSHAPCWLWTGRLTPDGYGRFDARPRPGQPGEARAHRWAWEHHHGHPIPTGLTLDHLIGPGEPCTSRACVRPDHLEAVTNAENLRRRHARRKATR